MRYYMRHGYIGLRLKNLNDFFAAGGNFLPGAAIIVLSAAQVKT